MPVHDTFSLTISYRQIAVFDALLDQPFNEWQPEHVQQGFAWRPGSVSFSTLVDTGEVDVLLRVGASIAAEHPECRIEVPFTVPAHRQVSVASITDEHTFELEPGAYQLHYDATGRHITLSFRRSSDLAFRIHTQDSAEKSLAVLSTNADPAD